MDRVNERPIAYLIADFSSAIDLFTLTKDPKTLSEDLIKANGAADQIPQSPADKWLQAMWPSMKDDPIGDEKFVTVFETPKVTLDAVADVRAYQSQHNMMLGVEGEQKFHIHPSHPDYKESSQRAVLVMGLHNEETGESGCQFEFFGVKDVSSVKNSGELYPRCSATPVDPLYRVNVKAGQVALLVFGAGIHRFSKQGVAISGHFFDVANDRDAQGSFLGNTEEYILDCGLPEASEDITLKEDGAIISGLSDLPTSILQEIFTGSSREMKDAIHKHGSTRFCAEPDKRSKIPSGATPHRITKTVNKLRAVAANSSVVPDPMAAVS